MWRKITYWSTESLLFEATWLISSSDIFDLSVHLIIKHA